jgi:tetratricopeptide (TPR) repeat protein
MKKPDFFPSKLGPMSFFALKSPLSTSDRIERRRLIFADSLALVTLFAITALLAVSTNYLYQSYASHQVKLADRWLQRGEQAMRDGKPQAAIDALSSALAFEPNQRDTEIKLAQALASAGRIQEATVYFNSLLESQQGSGVINLQLARLAVRQGDETQALDDYQRAIYGNWEGDGYVRRREVRFEMVKYLIERQQLDRARSELLVASGNAPEDDISIQLEIGRLMELAQDPADALHLYKTILRRHPSLREALEGAGSAAFQLGRYLEAKHYLSHALEGPAVDKEPAAAIATSRDHLNEAMRLLALYPSPGLRPGERMGRVLTDRKLAMARLAECTQDRAAGPAKDSPQASVPATKAGPLQSLTSRFSRHPAPPSPNPTANPAPIDPLVAITQRWQQLPVTISASDLEKDPELTQAQIQLIYDTELVTQQVCGAPSGDDALLLRIAQAPNQVEEE